MRDEAAKPTLAAHRPEPARRRLVLGLGLVAVLLLAGRAGADWLVLNDGSRVETDGAWSVEGRLVVFRTPGGTLSSLRLAEVDLEATDRANVEANEPPPVAAPAPPKKAVLVLTEADLPPASPVPAEQEEAGSGEGEAGKGAGSAQAGAGLEVGSWEQVPTPDGTGIQIYGTLENKTGKLATDLGVRVLLFDAAGNEVGSQEAVIGRRALPPGAKANFNATFPDVFSFAAAKFEPQYRSFETRALPQPAAAEEETAAEEPGAAVPGEG